MTAYGLSDSVFDQGNMTVEVQSVNRRFLEMSIQLPKELASLEMSVRKRVRDHLSRGAVSVRVSFELTAGWEIEPNTESIKKLQTAWERVAESIPVGTITADQWVQILLARPELFTVQSLKDVKALEQRLFTTLGKALKSLVQSREKEGQAIAKDLLFRLDYLEKLAKDLQKKAIDAPEKYREKLQARIQDFFQESSEFEEKILREIALFADKVDTSEEMTRIFSHIEQMKEVIEEKESGDCGKKLDFLCQELLREWNTVAAKSPSAEQIQFAVEAKVELEKIREQVQNVE